MSTVADVGAQKADMIHIELHRQRSEDFESFIITSVDITGR